MSSGTSAPRQEPFRPAAHPSWWLVPYVPGWALAAGVLPGAYTLQFADVARLSTSDMLAGALCLAALYLLFERRRHLPLSFALFSLAILARAEAIILGCMAATWLARSRWREGRARVRECLLAAGCLVAVYAGLMIARPGYGWRMAVSYCLLEHPPVPHVVAFTLGDYARLLQRQLQVALGTPVMLLWLSAWVWAVALAWRLAPARPSRDLLVLIGANLLVRFALFPALDYRYHLVFVATTAVVGLQVLALTAAGQASRSAVEPAPAPVEAA